MSDEYFVDGSKGSTAFIERTPETRGDLFAIETFGSISDVILAGENWYPL